MPVIAPRDISRYSRSVRGGLSFFFFAGCYPEDRDLACIIPRWGRGMENDGVTRPHFRMIRIRRNFQRGELRRKIAKWYGERNHSQGR